MRKNSVVASETPERGDLLTDVLRAGAQALIAQAVEAELATLLAGYVDHRDEWGRRLVVRNGYLPQREVLTGIGPVRVQVPKVRDRSGTGIRFTSALLPPYLRRAQRVEEVLPWLYLKGISTGDMQEALAALLGEGAQGLSPATISRLKAKWEEEHQVWSRRDLTGRRYVYIWVDGIHFTVRLEDAKQCLLVMIGVTAEGRKEFVAIEDGYRESEQSWLEVLRALRARGLEVDPTLAVGDGALGFWKALPQVYGTTRVQRCWVHKTANVLNSLPKGLQPKAKAALQEIWLASSRDAATTAFDRFLAVYGDKYPKATGCLEKDRDVLLTFYDFPKWPRRP